VVGYVVESEAQILETPL